MFVDRNVWYVCESKEREIQLLKYIDRLYPTSVWALGFEDLRYGKAGMSHAEIIMAYRQNDDSKSYRRKCIKVGNNAIASVERKTYSPEDDGVFKPYVHREILKYIVGYREFGYEQASIACEFAARNGSFIKVVYAPLFEITAEGMTRRGNYEEAHEWASKYLRENIDFKFKKVVDD